jgi:N-dimethylarginine dimethylaminohydrolase
MPIHAFQRFENMFQQSTETAPLRRVIIGRHEGYRAHPAYVEIVNEAQKIGLPTEDELRPEFEAFQKALEAEGVEVIIPEYVGKFVYDQLTPRDIGMVIGNRLLLCNMARASRRYEVTGIFPHILSEDGPEPHILIPEHPEALMEGGDLILDKSMLFVGISQRTNEAGLAFLQRTFGEEFEVVPVHCKALEEGENVLHLDCTFNPVGEQHCLIYPNGFQELPKQIKDKYTWIAVSREEQDALATNVLSIDPKTVISRKHPACQRVNEAMREIGLRVIELPFDGAPRTGGSFRCCSFPLERS